MRTKSPLLRLAASMIDLQHRTKVADALAFHKGEAEIFWPVYKDYETDLKQLNNTFIELVERYDARTGDLKPNQAWIYLEAFRILETERGHLVRRYASKLFRTCRPELIADWVQLEDDIAEEKRTQVSYWSSKADTKAAELDTLAALKERAAAACKVDA